jgi:hypothetical protein
VNLRRNLRGWLLWLALILPLAQAMAGVHALSHLNDRRDDSAVHLTHCSLCLASASLDGLATPPAPPAVASFTAAPESPPPVIRAPLSAAALPPYPARAPPAA